MTFKPGLVAYAARNGSAGANVCPNMRVTSHLISLMWLTRCQFFNYIYILHLYLTEPSTITLTDILLDGHAISLLDGHAVSFIWHSI